MGPLQIVLFAVWALSTLLLIALVLMHSGKGTGVSDMIASSLYNSSTATGVMEKNLDKLTVIVACVFAAASSWRCSFSRRALSACKDLSS